MPSSETITAFYTFVAGAQARSADVTTNFNNFRGHLIPIDPNTATAATTKTYDLGSSEHRWGTGYFAALDVSSTTTTAMVAQGLSSGAWDFRIGGTSVFKINEYGFIGANALAQTVNFTATAGNVAARSTISTTLTASGHVANSTCTLQTLGRPVRVGMELGTNTGRSYIQLHDVSITTALAKQAGIAFVVDGVIMPMHLIGVLRETTTKTVTVLPPKLPPNAFFTIDTPAAGYHTYSLYVTLGSNVAMTINNARLDVREF